MELDPETLREQIPYYLTDESRRSLLKELKTLTQSTKANFFLADNHNVYEENMLQGDGWRGFELFLFDTGKRQSVKGIVISNSCDIDPANRREISTKITFAPLVKLSAFKRLLAQSNIKAESVEAKIGAIRSQKTSNIFFIPAGRQLEEDYIVRLDDIHSMPIECYQKHSERNRLFTLSMAGFYLFVLKLSYHFCRFHEAVIREPATKEFT